MKLDMNSIPLKDNFPAISSPIMAAL